MIEKVRMPLYYYTYACHEDEIELCALELRALFGAEPAGGGLASEIPIDPSRSPFIRQRISVMCEGASVLAIAEQASSLQLEGATFKVEYIKGDTVADYPERRAIEREIGARIRGTADMRRPGRVFGVIHAEGRWLFGECRGNEAIWLAHNRKPRQYSTALSTRVARAVANIAVPNPQGVRAIDPCCGIGTVVIEALSMGIDIVGFDINPLAVRGARENLAHFGMPPAVKLGDIRDLAGEYDAAILDLPYNLCSRLTSEERLSMLQSARRLARKVVVIATERIDGDLEHVGFSIVDRCVVKKGNFSREIVICV